MHNYGILTITIIKLCVTGTSGLADVCINGPDIVPVCSNVTIPTNKTFIPINGSIGTGCICDVQMVEVVHVTDDYPAYFSGVDVNNLTCGYKVDVMLDTSNVSRISCSDDRLFMGRLYKNEFYRLIFTRDFTVNPPSTTGFCLNVYTTIKNTRFIITCWKQNTPPTTVDPSSTSLSPISNPQNASMSSQQTADSTTTDELTNRVKDNLIDEELPVAAIGGGVAGVVLLMIVIIIIVSLCMRRRNNNYDKPTDGITESSNYNTLRMKDEMVIIDNDLYVSYGHDKNQSTTSPTSDIQSVQGNTYANTNGQLSTAANHSTPDLQPVQGHTYANIDEQQLSKTNHSTSVQNHIQPSATTSENSSTHYSDMVILENDLYVSADSIPNSATENNKQTCDEQLNKSRF